MTDLLIVIDMQRDFVSGALGSPEARAITPAVAARIRRAKKEGTPVVLNASDGASLFDGLSAGDRVLVLCSGVNACWPGQSRAYLCLRLGGGSTDDLPAPTVQKLAELGWIPSPG